MSAEITYISSMYRPAHEALRNIADGLEDGSIKSGLVTVVIGTDIWCVGLCDDEQGVQQAVFDLNYVLHRIMAAANGIEL